MTIKLPPKLTKYVSEKVNSGAYKSADEMIRACLEQKRSEDERKLKELRKLIAEGIEDIEKGRVGPCDPLEVLEEVLAELDAKKAKGR